MSTPDPETISDKVRFRWDILLFTVFLATAVPAVTRVPAHEWLSLAFIPLLLVHLLFNWRWIADVTRRMFRALPADVRFNHIWDGLLFFLLTTVMVSGVLISESALPAMGLQIKRDPFWRQLHDMSTTFLMIGLGVHLAMHGRWIVARVMRRKPAGAAEGDKGASP